MTKRKLTPQQQLRKEIDAMATRIIDNAELMINQDVPIVLSFRLAISFELEHQHYLNLLMLAVRNLNAENN